MQRLKILLLQLSKIWGHLFRHLLWGSVKFAWHEFPVLWGRATVTFHPCTDWQSCKCTFMQTHICMRVHTHIHLNTHTFHPCTDWHLCKCTFMQTHICVRVHTHIHLNTHTFLLSLSLSWNIIMYYHAKKATFWNTNENNTELDHIIHWNQNLCGQ